MTPDKCEIKREEFEAYERVRKSGKFNMITDLHGAAREASLLVDRYVQVMRYYDECAKKWKQP